jgi:hypothetical protein
MPVKLAIILLDFSPHLLFFISLRKNYVAACSYNLSPFRFVSLQFIIKLLKPYNHPDSKVKFMVGSSVLFTC